MPKSMSRYAVAALNAFRIFGDNVIYALPSEFFFAVNEKKADDLICQQY
jgi:hypothetical protein